MVRPWLACLLVACSLPALIGADAAEVYRRAQKAEKKGDVVKAYLLYSQAAALEPDNRKYWGKSLALRKDAVLKSEANKAEAAAQAVAQAPAAETAAGTDPEVKPFEAKPEETPTTVADPAMSAPAPVPATPDPATGTASVTPSPDPEPQQAQSTAKKANFKPEIVDTISDKDLEEARKMLPPPELQPKPGRHSFNITGSSEQLWEKVAGDFGILVMFESEFTGRPGLKLTIDDASFGEAIRAVEAATSAFAVPVSDRMIMVAADSEVKRRQIEPNVAVVMSIPEPIALQDAQDLARTVQSAMEIQRMFLDGTRRMILVRDRISKVRPAQLLLEQLLYFRPQVQVEVEFIDISRKKSLDLGIDLPNSVTLAKIVDPLRPSSSSGLQFLSYIPQTFTRLITFGGGRTMFGLGFGDLTSVAKMSDTDVTTLMHAQMSALDAQPATLHIGDKYPIATNFYSYGSANSSAYPPQFNFEDLGLTLKITPKVHDDQELSLEVEAEFKVLGGQALNGIPIIQNRKFSSHVRMRDGEYAVLAGLLTRDEAHTLSGIAGLASVPILGALTSHVNNSKNMGESLIVIRPHIVAYPPAESETERMWVGSEARLLIPMK